MTAMMPIGELLEDKTFKRFFVTTPQMYPTQLNRDTWRVWVKTTADSPWRRKDVRDYQWAVRFILRGLDEGSVQNAVLQSRGVSYKPPVRKLRVMQGGKPVVVVDAKGVARPKINTIVWDTPANLTQEYGKHDWCYYCRRPTVFAYFAKHHNFRGTLLESIYDGDVRRCAVCGISYDSIRRY